MSTISAGRHGLSTLGWSGAERAVHPHASNVVQVTGEDETAQAATFSVFAAMPFDPAYDDVFHVAIRSAVESVGGRAVRVDQLMHGEDAVLITQRALRDCSAVVADLSTSEPDVLYELGMAHALGKPTVQICRTAYDDMPFMVRNRETLLYEAGRTHLLGQQLGIYLARVLGVT